MRRALTLFIILLISIIYLFQKVGAQCYEVSISTCVGDFANGGDQETGSRLLGNASGYSLSFIQHNHVSIFLASGTAAGNVSSSTTAGYVGILTDGITQFPQYPLDVWGVARTTDSLLAATATGYVAIGTIPVSGFANTHFVVANGTFTVKKNGNVGINTLNPSSSFEVKGGSISITGVNSGLTVTSLAGNSVLGTDSGGNIITGDISAATTTLTLKIGGGIFQSTIGACGFPGSCFSTGYDTYTVYGLWAEQVRGSTVGWTRLDIAFSTGGVKQIDSYRFPILAIGTATSSGFNSFAPYTSTTVVINAFTTFGVQVTTLPVSGLAPEETKVIFDLSRVRPSRY